MDIVFQQVGYTYQADTPMATRALANVSLHIQSGQYTAIIGHTGSGKSTLLQHLNALKKPTEGTIQIGDRVITSETSNKNLKPLRKQVGIVFQFPEAQLFEETVEQDIAFGPKNFGATDEEAKQIVREVLPMVGLDDSFLDRSPFELSGGQMRRVAIAGVLALEPKVLVLDEPTAGLDPQGQKQMMEMFHTLHKEKGLTIVLVTHQMEDAAQYADHVIVLEEGTVKKEGPPREIFANTTWLASKQLEVPKAVAFSTLLEERLGLSFSTLPLTTDQLATEIQAALSKAGGHD